MDDQIFDEQTRAEIPVPIIKDRTGWRRLLDKKIIIAASVAVVLIVGIFWYFLKPMPSADPTSNNVVLTLKGPSQQNSGTEAEYRIVYRNGENADLVNVSLEVLYPNGFKFKSAEPVPTSSEGRSFNLPPVKPGESGEVVVRGKLDGSTGEDKEIKARLHYRLSNFNSEFAAEQSIHTSILPPNLTLDVSGPVDVVEGQDSTFTVSFTNVSGQDFGNLAVQVAYPTGFNFTSSNPKPAKDNNYWTISGLKTSASGSISVTGSFTGDASQDKLVSASLGQVINGNFAPQIISTVTFKIIPSSLSLKISSEPKDVVHLSNTINYKLNYANQGSIGLQNLVITATLEGPSVDLGRLAVHDGIVSGSTITWKAATLPRLAVLSPNDEGEIDFSVPIKNNLTTNLKNQTVILHATISSSEASSLTRAADVQLKLASDLDLTIDGQYISGAAPMEVGKTTVFNMTFTLSSLSNDLAGTQVIASVPLPPSAWNDVVIHAPNSSDTLTYDSNSGKIAWHIGELPAFTGKFTPALRVSFQLSVTPEETDRSKSIDLLSNVQATGTDNFIGSAVQTPNVSSVNTGTIDDDVLNVRGTTVQ